MSDRETKRRLVGPWRNLHSAVWLIGLAILFWKGWWWPGILVLVGISMVIEALLQFVPQAYEEEETPQVSFPPALPTAPAVPPVSPAAAPPAPTVEHRADLLPAACPKCGGPLRGHEVKWTGVQSADCPFCGTNLPMAKV